MRTSLAHASADGISSDRRSAPRLPAADLRKAEHPDWLELGQAVERTRTLCRLSLKEFADALRRDERQVARWIAGTEQAQAAVIFAVERFRRPFVVALANARATA
jgi:hypothetical protein